MMKICLTNLRKFNEGYSIERWLELPASNEEIEETLKDIGINEECGEYFISDYECDFPGIIIKENSTIDDLNDMADQLYDMNEEEIKIVTTIMKNENCSLDKAREEIDNRLVIPLKYNDSNTDVNLALSYIEKLYGDVINLDKETLGKYFDFKSFGEDLRMSFNLDEDETIAVSDN